MLEMVKFKINSDINEPPDIVWNAFKDPDNMLHYTKYLEKVEVIQGTFGEVGAIAHLYYLEKGRSYILEDKLLEYESRKRILSQVTGQGMNIEVETIFEEIPKGTKISMVWNGTAKSILVRIILNLMRRRIKKHAQAELDTFKSLVETYGISFPENRLKE